jgi:hypothetical protein
MMRDDVTTSDDTLRVSAARRKPFLAREAPDVPPGFINTDDAVEYMKRRWGPAVRTEMIEQILSSELGPKTLSLAGVAYYAFDEIDLWVYRTLSGVPASWRENLGRASAVPVYTIEVGLEEGRLVFLPRVRGDI